jgi:hypothetical protein
LNDAGFNFSSKGGIMAGKDENRVRLTDKMVLIGLGIGVAYWIIECVLYLFLSYEFSFLDRLLGPDLNGLSTRIIVICLFLMFGSHAQYTINKRKKTDGELQELRRTVDKLRLELESFKNK